MNTTEQPSVPQLLALSTQICKKNLKARNQITPTKYCLGRPGFPAHSQHSLHVMSPYYDCLFHFFPVFRDKRKKQGGRKKRIYLFGAASKTPDAVSGQASSFSLLQIFHDYRNIIIKTSENHKINKSWLGFVKLCGTTQLRLRRCWSPLSCIIINTEFLISLSKTWLTLIYAVLTPKKEILLNLKSFIL